MNFIGHYYHALEQKGRLAIPSIFRANLGEKVILTRGFETCLHIFPLNIWDKTVSQVPLHPFGKKSDREWIRLITHNSQEAELDSQGRVNIESHLINFAGLKKDCVIAGSVNYLEIWDQQTYHTYMESLENKIEEITKQKFVEELL